jgi:hypothetical protein
MTWRELLALPFVLVALAVLVAVGSLAWRVGDTWEPRNTDILITGLVTSCAGGMVVIGMILGMAVGIPFMIRMLQESRSTRYDDYSSMRAPTRTIDGTWKELPGDAQPLLPMIQQQAPTQQMPMMNVSLDAIDNDDTFGSW